MTSQTTIPDQHIRRSRQVNARRVFAAGVTLVLTLSATACGSGSKAGLSSSDFVKQANAICTDVRAQMKAVAAPKDVAGAATAYGELLKISQAGTDKLAALNPSGDAKTARDNLVDAIDAANTQLKAAVKAAQAKDEAGLTTAGDAYSAKLQKLTPIATAGGLTECVPQGGATTDTTPVDTTTVDTTPADTTPLDTTATSSGVQYVDPTSLVTAWDGQTFVSLNEKDAKALTDSLASNPSDPVKVVAAGALDVTDTASKAETLVLFFELDRTLSDSDVKLFLGGVVGKATDANYTTVGSTAGVTYTTPDGLSSFATVHATTAIIVIGQDSGSVTTTVTGLFAANPTL